VAGIVLLKLFLLFIIVPLVELALLLKLADATSWELTLGLVIVTGAAGSLLARSQGWRAYRRIHEALASGNLPAEPMLDAVLIFVAGALLLTPGILTDLFGFSLLIPWTRAFYRRRLTAWFKSRFRSGAVHARYWHAATTQSEIIDSDVIDSHVVNRPAPGDDPTSDPRE
jgi:UPF0716 protein FxsA